MRLTPDIEPHLRMKRLSILGVLGFVSFFLLSWGAAGLYFGILGFIEALNGIDYMVILKILFFVCGCYVLSRLFPKTIIYLFRECNGRYQIELSRDGISILPHFGPPYSALLNEIEGSHIHHNLIGCKAISIIKDNGSSWTFGSLYSEASLLPIKLGIDTAIEGNSNQPKVATP